MRSINTSATFTLALFVLVGPLLDLLNGYFILKLGWSSLFTPGVIYRGFFLTVVFVVLTFRSRSTLRYVCLYFLTVFFLSNLLCYPDENVELMGGLSRFLKIVFPIVGFGALMDFGLRISDSGMKGQSAIHNPQSEIVWRVGSWYGLIVAGSIVGLYAADAHVPSYAYQAFSSKAVFKAQNDAGVILVLALGVSLYVNYTYRANNPLYLLALVGLYLAGGLLLSTRAAIAGVPLVVLSFYLFVLVKGRGLRRRVYTLGLLGGLVVLSFAAFQFWLQHDVGYTVRRFGLLLEPWAFRRKVPEALDQIAGFSAVEHLFGAGEAGFPLTENDIVDIYGKFGLMTLIPLLAFFGVFYLGLFKRLFVSKTLSAFVLFICFTFYIAHAALAGHALMSAPVNNLFMVLYWLAYRERQGLGVGG